MNLASGELRFTCEHASAGVPRAYASLFAAERARAALRSHRGSDLGAAALGKALARRFGKNLRAAGWTRLLIDLNRSPHHRGLFSEYTRRLPPAERARIFERYYRGYREELERDIASAVAQHGVVFHIAVHSFTPVLGGRARTADIGLLYDPRRPLEAELCRAWKAALSALAPDLRVRRNYPYLGTADGLTTALRRRFDAERYAGVELEVSQALLKGKGAAGVHATIAAALERALGAPLREAACGARPRAGREPKRARARNRRRS